MKGQGRRGKAVVFALTDRGVELAGKIASAVGRAEVLEPSALRSGGLAKEVAKAFKSAGALVFISAVGIAVRCVAPLLKGKHVDPAVVVVDERGRYAVSLLSGHMGGANALTGAVAKATGASPVITTATDIWGLPSVEELAESFGLRIEDPKRIRAVNSAILNHEKVFVVDADKKRREEIKGRFKGVFTCGRSFPGRLGAGGACVLVTSSTRAVSAEYARRTLVLRPAEIVVGVGCCKGATKAMIKKAFTGALASCGLSPLSIKCFATIDIKKNERGLMALAKEMGVEIEAYGAGELNRVKCPSRPSTAAMKAAGAYGVAEPAALISSGASKLCLKKTKTGHVTIAAALIPSR